MSRVKIETLTPVHIGSGEMLQYGNDFVRGKYKKDDVLGIVDDRKVMELIGEEHLNHWVAAINKGVSTDEIVRQFAPSATVKDYSKRVVALWVNKVRTGETMKESIHDGMGKPYIPGSSLKGAIRTAVVSLLAENLSGLQNLVCDDRGKTGARRVESKLFGSNPNADAFRFLQVGDAFFDEECGVATRMVNINERTSNGFWDESKPQLIEAICNGEVSEFEIRLNTARYKTIKGWDSSNALHSLPSCFASINTLFQTINKQTRSLLESELTYWEKRQDKDEDNVIDDYLGRVNDILDAVNSCESGDSCILRVGHGSGWRFITGAWSENIDIFYQTVVPAARPGNNKKYTEYEFPKTRRVDDSCELLGFVKLTQLS